MDRYQDNIRDIIYTPFWSTFYYRTKNGAVRPTWRFWRWMSVIVINIAFFISYHLDVQLLEGTMNGSRLLGFHLIDLFTVIETWSATHVLHTNMIIGSITIAVFYLLAGGKSFCAWACPYGVLSEIGEAIHMNLVRKKNHQREKLGSTDKIRLLGRFYRVDGNRWVFDIRSDQSYRHH